MIGTWTDKGSSWTGSIPYTDAQWHYGPARIWTTPLNTDNYGKKNNETKTSQHSARLTKYVELFQVSLPNEIFQLFVNKELYRGLLIPKREHVQRLYFLNFTGFA